MGNEFQTLGAEDR